MLKTLDKQFESLLNRKSTSENTCQKFLEDHTELFYTPSLLNHQLHWQSIISKFPITTSLITDFMYLTKSSIEWRIVFVELERPDLKLFTNDSKHVVPTSGFTKALAQINSWIDYIANNRDEVLKRIDAIRRPQLTRNVSFKYVLILGRRPSKQEELERLSTMSDSRLKIFSYDSLISHYRNSHEKRPKNVIRMKSGKYEFKHMNVLPEFLFAHLTPSQFRLSKIQKIKLMKNGYDIKAWEQGKFLEVDGRTTRETLYKKFKKQR